MKQRRVTGILCFVGVVVAGCGDVDSSSSNRRTGGGAPVVQGESRHAAEVLGRVQRAFDIAPPAGRFELTSALRNKKERVSFFPRGSARGFVRERESLRPFFREGGVSSPKNASGATPAAVTLPATAAQHFDLRDRVSGLAISVSLRGARSVKAEVAQGYAVYPSAYAGDADVLHRPFPLGTEEYIVFGSSPDAEQATYDVTLDPSVAGLRVVANSVEFLDRSGTPRLRMAPPFVLGESGTSEWARVTVEGCSVDTNVLPPYDRPVVAPGAPQCAVHVTWRGSGIKYPAVLDPSWTVESIMGVARTQPGAARVVVNGQERAIVFGGSSAVATTGATEIYDPSTGTWAQTGSMVDAVEFVPSVVLSDGRVLALGGYRTTDGTASNSVQVYNPATGQWTLDGALDAPRAGNSATLLPNGRILVVGGISSSAVPLNVLQTAVQYDPSTHLTTAAGTTSVEHAVHTATLLGDGKVLVAGGLGSSEVIRGEVDVYNSSTNTWSSRPPLPMGPRYLHDAVLLPNGRLLVAGGNGPDGIGQTLETAIYDPSAGTWSTGPNASESHFTSTATLLSQGANAGKVLLTGGDFGLTTVELFDPAASSWSTIGALAVGRDSHVAVPLGNKILFAAGTDGAGGVLASAELYDPDAAVAAGNTPVQAPPLDRTVVTTTAMQAQFLYSGPSPLQVGVGINAIDPTRASIVHGEVFDRDTGAPLAGVTVAVVDHPELGSTTTQSDGRYYLAVNGGETYVLNATASAHLQGRRRVAARKLESTLVPDLALILAPAGPPSPAFAMSLDGQNVPPGPSRLFHGPTSTDSDGQRQVAVYFPPNVTATVNGPSGATQLSTVTVRAAEYTVGTNGVTAMPAALPPTSGYTYAVELTVDQGTNATFNPPVPVYVDNFLSLPVGTSIPSGYYDLDSDQWVSSTNGRVIKIISVTAGKADLDIAGTGAPATTTALAALGITDSERTELAASYAVGKALWRVPVGHFSTWDFNNGIMAPLGALAGIPSGNLGDNPDSPCDIPAASTIECETQVLREEVPVAGTPFTLQYRSDRTLGRKDRYSLRIPATPHVIPGPLLRADVTVTVAGRTFKQSFPPTPDQLLTFTWDGYDAFGRLLQGTQHATVLIDNVYNGVYGNAPSFGMPASASSPIGPSRTPIELGGSRTYDIGSWDAEGIGIGGWDLDVHHAYDPIGKSIQLGSGAPPPSNRSLSNIITTVAGGASGDSSPDGTVATQGAINAPHDVAIGPDGLVYFSEFACIRRITAAGLLQTLAGDCAGGPVGGPSGGPIQPEYLAFGPTGDLYFVDLSRIRKLDLSTLVVTTVAGSDNGINADDIPATTARLASPSGIVLAPDGTLYIADQLNESVRKVGADGIIHTVAGGGGLTPAEGLRATQVSLAAKGLALGPDGSLYVSEAFSSNRVLRIGNDSVVHIFAGIVGSGPRGDGGPATAASIDARDLAIAPDGTVFVKESRSVRQIDPAGIISTVAGNLNGGSVGDGGPATLAFLSMQSSAGIAVSPDGTLYIADGGGRRVRRVAGALPDVKTTDVVLPSRDGRELYVFNFAGKHLRTLDAFVTTAPPLFQFAYDPSSGFLTTVTDVDGNVTTIQRDGAGRMTGIQAPFGQVTATSLLGDGYLGTITDPANETTRFTYYPGGLMKTKTSPRGFVSSFTYDAQGRLTQDSDPPEAGGFHALARTETPTGWTVNRSTRLNRTTNHVLSQAPGVDRTRTNTLPDGHVATIIDRDNGTHATTLPDGTILETADTPDPRFGMASPITSTTIRTPGGLIRTETVTRTADLTDPTNVLSLTSATERHVINGRIYDTGFDPVTRRFSASTPVGRTTVVTLDGHSHVTSTQLGFLLAHQLTYDSRGRLFTSATGTRTTQYSYDTASGFLRTITDPLTQVTQLTPDAIGRTTRITYPDTNFTQLGYDADSNLTSITPPGQPQHLQSFNAVNLLASYQPPAASGTGTTNTTYGYDFDRALKDLTRPDGIIVHKDYDSAGRLQTVTLPTGTITRTYDPATGRLATISGPGSEALSFGYDGFLQTSTTFSGPVAGTVTMTYDNDFRVVTRTVNATPAIAFGYDSDGLLTSAGAMTATRQFATGLLDSTILGVVQDSVGYDSFGALASYAANASSTSVFSENVTLRDALGRIKTKTETVQGTTHSYEYTYDTRGRLTDVKIDGVQHAHYAFDGAKGQNGNRTSATIDGVTTSATYDNQDRLLTYGTTTYTYGANGELKTKLVGGQTTTYTYDALGNLLTVALPGGPTIDYVVDGLGRRVGKKVNGTLVKGFLYESQLRVIAELDGNNNLVAEFVYGDKVNVPEYMIRAGVTYRLLTDHLGSVRLVVNTATGTVAERIDYDEFGVVTSDSNAGFQPFGFAGGLYDADTKLVRFGARDYDATTGRWTRKDPIRFSADQENFYVYVQNEPINLIDPSGTDAFTDALAAIAGAAGALADLIGASAGAALGAAAIVCSYFVPSDSSEDESECNKQWRDAYERCAELITSKQTPARRRLRGRPDYGVRECAKGFVSQKCGGNVLDNGSK